MMCPPCCITSGYKKRYIQETWCSEIRTCYEQEAVFHDVSSWTPDPFNVSSWTPEPLTSHLGPPPTLTSHVGPPLPGILFLII